MVAGLRRCCTTLPRTLPMADIRWQWSLTRTEICTALRRRAGVSDEASYLNYRRLSGEHGRKRFSTILPTIAPMVEYRWQVLFFTELNFTARRSTVALTVGGLCIDSLKR